MSNYPLNLPNSLKREAQRRAKEDGVSLNQWIAVAVAQKVGAADAADFFRQRASDGNGSANRLLLALRAAPDRKPDSGDEMPAAFPKSQ
ncbi:MAG: toxin-antitoxin system HicB family antitoxin [Rhodospirillaceae bacterium]